MQATCVKTEYYNGIRHTTEQKLVFTPDEGCEEWLINLYPQYTYQTLQGFGGAITESAAYVYSLLSPEQKQELMRMYFGPDGMNYCFVRISIDSCDFSLSHYEADGFACDETLERFSFARVEQYILPMLRDAERAHGEKLEIMLSPGSPPAYTKTNGDRNHGGKLKPCYEGRWAEYICRYILEFRRRGFHVRMLTLQNEPKAVQNWDSCVYTAREEQQFLRNAIWPALVRHGLENIGIYIWDHNKERALEWAGTILDPQTAPMVAGVAFHWYSGDHFEALRILREQFPEKHLVSSETCIEFSKYSAKDDLLNAHRYAHEILGDLNAGMETFLDWNLLLDERGGPNHAGNYCDAPYLFHEAEKRLETRALQAYIWHFSRFLRPDSVRIGVSRYTDQLEATACKTDTQIAVVLLNRTEQTLSVRLRLYGMCARTDIPPLSIASCTIAV